MLAFLNPVTLRLMMGLTFFPLGLFSIISGLIILVAGPYKQEAKVLAQQTARIAKKVSPTISPWSPSRPPPWSTPSTA